MEVLKKCDNSETRALPPTGPHTDPADSADPRQLGIESGHDRLARRLGDLLLTGAGQMAPTELALAETALVDLLPFMDQELKRRFAERLAPLETAPAALLSALLDEPLDVSGPLVEEGQCLTNCDQVRVAEEGDVEHRRCLAGRQGLARVVCDALTARGEVEVLGRLLANDSASLSPRALEQILRRSSSHPELIAGLLRRRELTPWFAHLLFWWADGEERTLILKRFPMDRKAIVEALADIFDLESLAGADEAVLQRTYRLLRPAVRLDDAAWQRLCGGIDSGMAQPALAAAADIAPTTAAWIIADDGGEPLAILGKALGLARDDFRDLAARLSTSRLSGAHSENEMERSVALFDSVTIDRADSILHFWDRIISAETRP